jgi:hypothetical protein
MPVLVRDRVDHHCPKKRVRQAALQTSSESEERQSYHDGAANRRYGDTRLTMADAGGIDRDERRILAAASAYRLGALDTQALPLERHHNNNFI